MVSWCSCISSRLPFGSLRIYDVPRVSLPLLVHRVHLFFTNPLRLYHILSIVPCVSVLQVILIARGRDTFEGMEVLVCRGSSLSFKSYGLILLSYLVIFFHATHPLLAGCSVHFFKFYLY